MNLIALANGMPGLTAAFGRALAEATAVCLEDRSHESGVLLTRGGIVCDQLEVEWPPVEEQTRLCYADMQETTEWGACGIAILLVEQCTGLVVIERSRKGTGFDYWLGEEDGVGLSFRGLSRLEVSGILNGTRQQIDARVKQKKSQMKPTDHIGTGIVAVVEFGTPTAHVERQ